MDYHLKTHRRVIPGWAGQSGMTLIEVMIAMVIGLIVFLVVSKAYVGGLTTKRVQTDVSRLNETTRFTFDLISRETRKLGYANVWMKPLTSAASVTCGRKILFGINDATQIDPAAADLSGSTVTILNKSDVLRLSYYGEDDAGGAAADGSVLDCHGYGVRRKQRVNDVLYVANDAATNEPSLYCYTDNPDNPHAGTSLPLVTSVESLQLLYGEDTNRDGVVNRYVPWNLVSNSDNIISIKVSVVARSLKATSATDTASPTFRHFSGGRHTSDYGVTYTYDYDYPSSANSDTGAVFSPAAVDKGRLRTMAVTEVAVRNFCDASNTWGVN
jgi:type IV pilus assembly protein PilW